MTVKYLKHLSANMKSGEASFNHAFNTGANVICFKGESGSGKTSAENGIRLALLKQVWIDILGGEYKDGKMICKHLNDGEAIKVVLEHSKGTSTVNLAPNKYGRFAKDGWHSGYSVPRGGNLAARVKDLLTRSPAKMMSMLTDLVISEVTPKAIIGELKDTTAKDMIAACGKQGMDGVGAVNQADEDLAVRLKYANAELKPLLAAQDEGAYEINPDVLISADQELDYWVSMKARYEASLNKTYAEQAEIALREEIQIAKGKLAELYQARSGLNAVDHDKIEAYQSGKTLANYALHKGMTKCPLCNSDAGMRETAERKQYKFDASAPAKFFTNVAGVFQSLSDREESNADVIRYSELTTQIKGVEGTLDRAEFALEQLSLDISTEAPQFSIETIQENIDNARAKMKNLNNAQARYEAQKDRVVKIDKLQARVAALKETRADITRVRNIFVTSKINGFIEHSRMFMPKPSAMRGGVLHFSLEDKRVGLFRNGRVHSPSGSERVVIVCAMALAAGSNMKEPPPVFLDDVGWGVDLLEAALVAWTKYKGIVVISTTAKVRQSKVGKLVEIVDITQVTDHTSMEAEEIEVVCENSATFLDRPEDYGTSMFAMAFGSAPKGTKVIVTLKQRKGKGFVHQQFQTVVSSVNAKGITLMADEGFGFTMDRETGKALYNGGSEVTSLPAELVRQTYLTNMRGFLGYSEHWECRLDQAEAIWTHQISAEDLPNRRDLVPE